MNDATEVLSDALTPLAVRAAVEGIPVKAIARILAQSSELVFATLYEQHVIGRLVEIPKADWPPTARLADRIPQSTRKTTDEDLRFACRQRLRLTNLEGSFLAVLLKYDRVDKTKLHHVIETQRYERSVQPDKQEVTDVKMVDVMICKLRKKLRELDPRFVIETVWGTGYYISEDVKALITQVVFPEEQDGQSADERGAPAVDARPRRARLC